MGQGQLLSSILRAFLSLFGPIFRAIIGAILSVNLTFIQSFLANVISNPLCKSPLAKGLRPLAVILFALVNQFLAMGAEHP